MKNTVKKFAGTLLAIVLVALTAIPAFAAGNEKIDTSLMNPAWVNTNDGRKLNVRQNPDGKVLKQLETGTQLYVDDFVQDGKWAKVVLNDKKTTGYVMTKYIQEGKPGKYELTEREDNFKAVSNGRIVTAKALNNKSSKSVALRAKPTKSSKQIRRLTAGDQLKVLAEGKTWLKVQDLKTGKTGYVAKDYVV